MAKREDMKKGVEVWIKNPTHIYAEVIEPRHGDRNLLPEDVLYKVRILPSTQYVSPEDVELVDPPKDPNDPPRYMSAEWVQELERCIEVMSRAVANPGDIEIAKQVRESLGKLGFMVKIP